MARGFAEEFGSKRVRELQPYEFDQWLAAQTQWNPTIKAHAVALILASISWAKKKGFIQGDPLTGRIERPQAILRGREAPMSDDLMDLMLGECFAKATYNRRNRTGAPAVHLKSVGCCEQFGRCLWLLRITGARPIEIQRAEAFNYQNGRIVFRWNATKGYTHKTAKKTQRVRVIFLATEAQAFVEECIKRYPEGPFLRTLRGTRWSRNNIASKWRWLLSRPKIAA